MYMCYENIQLTQVYIVMIIIIMIIITKKHNHYTVAFMLKIKIPAKFASLSVLTYPKRDVGIGYRT